MPGRKPTLMKINQWIFALSLRIATASLPPPFLMSFIQSVLQQLHSHLPICKWEGRPAAKRIVINYNATVHNRNCISLGDENELLVSWAWGFECINPPFCSCYLLIFFFSFIYLFFTSKAKGIITSEITPFACALTVGSICWIYKSYCKCSK